MHQRAKESFSDIKELLNESWNDETYNKLKNDTILKKVKEVLDTASELYYNEGTTPYTDEEFDKILKRYEDFTGLPYSTLTSPKKGKKLVDASHDFPELVGTLDKAYDTDELFKWYDSKATTNEDNVKILVSPKYDGNSVVLSFDITGKLVTALTRGKDGKGLDLTDFFKDRTIDTKAFQTYFATNDNIIGVKCEALITYKDFELIQEKMGKSYANPRSLVAGILNSDDGYKYAGLVSLAPIRLEMKNKSDLIKLTREIDHKIILENIATSKGFKSVPVEFYEITGEIDDEIKNDLSELYSEFVDGYRDSLPYMIDGLVIEFMDEDIRNLLGRRNDRDNYSIALKFPYLSKKTKIKDIKFYMAKTGRVTPVAVFETLDFNGAKCDHVSLSNYARFNELQLGVGSSVIIEYHADVMSYLISDPSFDNSKITPIEFIDKCPLCDSDLVINENETFVFCENLECQSNVVGKLVNWLSKLDIKGVKESTLEKLHDADLLSSIEDLYSLTKEEIMNVEGFKETSANNIIKAINSVTEIYDYQLFGSLLFKNFGLRKNKELFKKYTMKDIINDDKTLKSNIKELLIEVEGISDIMADNFIDGYNSSLDTIKFIMEKLTIKNFKDTIDSSKESYIVVFTGFRDKDLQSRIELDGSKVTSSVSKNTNYLVTKDVNGTSSKLLKAKELGIPIFSPEEFKSKFGY